MSMKHLLSQWMPLFGQNNRCLLHAGSVASLWQQAGRAGRREQPSTSIYIAFDGPLDQYFMKQPDKLFGRAIERAQVCNENLLSINVVPILTVVIVMSSLSTVLLFHEAARQDVWGSHRASTDNIDTISIVCKC